MATAVKTQLIAIGNSRGVRIPKPLLDQANLGTEIEIVVRAEGLMLRSATRPRAGWEEQFRAMAERGDDRLLDEAAPTTWDATEWEW
jgi:antitoxin MazE